MDMNKRRWVVLVASCLINLCIGSMYAWSVFAGPMSVELGGIELSIVFSIANVFGFVGMIIGGLLAQKIGPKLTVFIGGIMFGVGMLTCAFAQSLGHLILTYGFILGLGLSFTYGNTINTCIRFFPDKRGFAGGITTACYGISSIIITPIANALNERMGVRGAFLVTGIVFLVIIVVASLFITNCPADFVPAGYNPPDKKAGSVDKTPIQMLKSPYFYVLFVMLISGAITGMMVISNAKGLATNIPVYADDAAKAAIPVLLVSVLCAFNTAGRLIVGSLSDKFGRINTVLMGFIIAVIGIVLLIVADQAHTFVPFVIGLCLVGICFGTIMGVFPGFSTDHFGQKYNTINYGIMWIAFATAGVVGPQALVNAYSASGQTSYMTAFIIALALTIIGIVFSFIYRVLVKKDKKAN